MINWIWGEACWVGRCWVQQQGCRISEYNSIFNVWLADHFQVLFPFQPTSGQGARKIQVFPLLVLVTNFIPASPPDCNKTPIQPPFPTHLSFFFLFDQLWNLFHSPQKSHYVSNKHFTDFWYMCGIISLSIQTKFRGGDLPLQVDDYMNKWGSSGYVLRGGSKGQERVPLGHAECEVPTYNVPSRVLDT